MSDYLLSPPTIDDICKGGFNTPFDAPMVPPFPFSFRNAEILTIYWRTDIEAIKFLLPPPLEAISDIACLHIYQMNDTDWLGNYQECNVMIGSRYGEHQGGYSPYLVLSSDVGVAHGRETHGQPKKLGNPSINISGDLIVGSVNRNGIDVAIATLPYKQKTAKPEDIKPYFDFATNLNLKAIDHIDGTAAIRQLTSRSLADVKIHEAWGGASTIELHPNAQLPLHHLPVKTMLEGFYWRADFTLVAGDIIYDYLQKEQK